MKKLIFNNVTLSVIDKDGEQWLTAKDLAYALYPYERVGQNDAPFAGKIIKNYNRNKEEFTNKMTCMIDIQTSGGVQKVRVFSLRGAHLIAMFARTERAKQFRRWLLDLIETHNDEIGLLRTEYHQALALYEIGGEVASIHGKGLSQWKHRKQTAQENIERIQRQIQPELFITA